VSRGHKARKVYRASPGHKGQQALASQAPRARQAFAVSTGQRDRPDRWGYRGRRANKALQDHKARRVRADNKALGARGALTA